MPKGSYISSIRTINIIRICQYIQRIGQISSKQNGISYARLSANSTPSFVRATNCWTRKITLKFVCIVIYLLAPPNWVITQIILCKMAIRKFPQSAITFLYLRRRPKQINYPLVRAAIVFDGQMLGNVWCAYVLGVSGFIVSFFCSILISKHHFNIHHRLSVESSGITKETQQNNMNKCVM